MPGYAGALAALSTTMTYGMTAGLVIAAGATRFGTLAVTNAWRAARDDVPLRLMAFLDDAHRERGVLRSNGAVYQFRHDLLREQVMRRPL
jgi:hypothetical protein